MTNWYLGTMGFGYKQWLGAFYPSGLSSHKFLPYYAERFNAVEIDSTFYGTPRSKTVQGWGQKTPPHFRFCPKIPREISHDLRLVGVRNLMTPFLQTMRHLGDKLGIILLQLPPDFTVAEVDSLARFLRRLPTDIRFAVEFRHDSWLTEATYSLLRQYQIGLVATDYIHLPKTIRPTTDFLYMRFIGPHGQFETKHEELVDQTAVLQHWHTQLHPHLTQFKQIYGFFNNDFSGHSPATCNRFKKIVGLPTKETRVRTQGRLFE